MLVNLPDKLYYSIGEIAEAFDVKTSLLRFWENEFEVLCPKKNKSGTRKYTPKNVETIQLIYLLVKEKGMTLEGAKKQINQKSKLVSQQDILIKLEEIKSELKKISDQL
tara:strand:- start:2363 stop:2689 length:327 start_codon:yes stop_codon:yes gene_type:complete